MKSSLSLAQNKEIYEVETYKYLMIHRFLEDAGKTQYRLERIPNDCSKRVYYRVFTTSTSYILMDSTEDLQSVQPFAKVCVSLLNIGINAPEVYHADLDSGLMLLEDFGQTSLTKALIKNPELEMPHYIECIEILKKLYNTHSNFNISDYTQELLDSELNVFVEWYLKYNVSNSKFIEARDELFNIFHKLYRELVGFNSVPCLRDFMADNIFVTHGNPKGMLGVIDFQDAVLGSPAYDLVSLLEDARRDVNPDVVSFCKAMYRSALGLDEELFQKHYTILSLQRNLKIVGIFHRRNLRDGEPRYLDYLPRVWKFIFASMSEDIGLPISKWFEKYAVKTPAK